MHLSKHQMAFQAKEIPFRTIFNTENSLKLNFRGLQDVTAGFYISVEENIRLSFQFYIIDLYN